MPPPTSPPSNRGAASVNSKPLSALSLLWQLLFCLLPIVVVLPSTRQFWQADFEAVTYIVNTVRIAVTVGDLLLMLGCLLFVLDTLQNQTWQRWRHPFTYPMWALVIWAGISVGWVSAWQLSLYNSFHLLLTLVMALGVMQMVRLGNARFLIWGLLLGAILQSLVAVGQSLNDAPLGLTWLGERQNPPNSPFDEGAVFRAYGLTIHPNPLGAYLMLALILSPLIWHRRRWEWSLGVIWLGSLFIIVMGLLATGSRTTQLSTLLTGAVLGALTFFAHRGNLSRQMMIRLLLVFLMVSGIVGLLMAIVLPDSIQRLRELGASRQNLEDRFTYAFEDTLILMDEQPILGVGHGNLIYEIGKRWEGSRLLLLPAHNSFVFIWAELGVIGLLLFCLVLIPPLNALHSQNHWTIWVSCGAMLAICIAMLFDFYFWGDLRSRTLLMWSLGIAWGYLSAAGNPASAPAMSGVAPSLADPPT